MIEAGTERGTDPAVAIADLWAGYGRLPVLRGLSLELAAGRSLGIAGPNGAGKTTLFKVILGLLAPARGSLTVMGRRIETEKDRTWVRRQAAYLPQRSAAGRLPVSVGDAVLMGRWGKTFASLKKPGPADRHAVRRTLEEVGLAHKERADCRYLSGGEQQKTALARALIREAPILLLDEPDTYLDSRAKREMTEILNRIRRRRQLTLIAISHDLAHLREIADSILVLEDGRLGAAP